MSDVEFYNKPVTLEEYNETLRASVNAYYEHAKNDPSMSQEEVIQNTAEMSEKYLDAVDEFNEATEMENNDPAESCDDGIDL